MSKPFADYDLFEVDNNIVCPNNLGGSEKLFNRCIMSRFNPTVIVKFSRSIYNFFILGSKWRVWRILAAYLTSFFICVITFIQPWCFSSDVVLAIYFAICVKLIASSANDIVLASSLVEPNIFAASYKEVALFFI